MQLAKNLGGVVGRLSNVHTLAAEATVVLLEEIVLQVFFHRLLRIPAGNGLHAAIFRRPYFPAQEAVEAFHTGKSLFETVDDCLSLCLWYRNHIYVNIHCVLSPEENIVSNCSRRLTASR